MTIDAAVLQALRAAGLHIPLGELAAQLATSSPEVAAAIARLTSAGFDIESHPSLGCRLLSAPDRLLADDLHSRLGDDCSLAREILVFEETSSTNDVAAKLGREGHPGGLVVFAERQTAGRGRFGRRWDSAGHAGLWFSLLLRPQWPLARWPRLTTWAGVSVAAAVEHCTSLPARIKWPNDVLIHGRKVSGILIESASDSTGAMFAVAGIGMNVNQEEFPAELATRAASLRQLTGRPLDRAALATAILRELAARLPTAATGDTLIAEATRRSALLGTWVRLQSGTETLEGTAESLDPEGNLLLRLPDATLHRATAGEVTSQVGQ